MTHEVLFDRDAEADLVGIYDYVRDRTGSAAVAENYTRILRGGRSLGPLVKAPPPG